MEEIYKKDGISLRRGRARVEFNALKGEIVQLMEQGYSLLAVHEKLTSEKRMAMKYQTLSYLFRKCFGKCKTFYNHTDKVNPTNTNTNNEVIEQPQKNKQQTEQAKKHHTELKEKNDTFMMENYDPVGNSQQNEKKENN